MSESKITSDDKDITYEKLLNKLRSQFLSCYPTYSLDWNSIPENLSWEQQEMLLAHTVGQPLNRSEPIKLPYQLSFLKRLISTLERGGEVHDVIYEEYCKMQQKIPLACGEEYVNKHYLLPERKTLSMLEAETFVGKGTTGLCTWEASLALTDFLLQNPEYARNKNIFELGAGTGLCGMTLILCKIAKHVTLTDGSDECVDLMRLNVIKNFPNAKETAASAGSFEINDGQSIKVAQMYWENVEKIEFSDGLQPDLLLAADVVYDEATFGHLINAIDVLFRKSGDNVKCLLSATVRNEETLAKFLKLLQKKFSVQDVTVSPEDKRILYWDRNSIIRILEITREKL